MPAYNVTTEFEMTDEREWGLAEDYNPGKFWPQ